jgi:hypothetical protein
MICVTRLGEEQISKADSKIFDLKAKWLTVAMIRSVVWEVKCLGIDELLFRSTCRKIVFYRTTSLCDCYPADLAQSGTFNRFLCIRDVRQTPIALKDKALSVS